MDHANLKSENDANEVAGGPHLHAADRKKTILIIVVVALVLIAGMWLWKTIEISRLSKQAETERKALKIEATSQIMQAHEAHLILLAKPLIWALRTEMLQGNLSQVNLYLNDLVKEKGIQRIVIADPKGTIIASTNKKDEGQPFTSIGNQGILTSEKTAVEHPDSSVLIMSSPIMGFNNRLGTVLIRYAAPQPNLN